MTPAAVDVYWAIPDLADIEYLDERYLARSARFRRSADAARYATVRRLAESALSSLCAGETPTEGVGFAQRCQRCGVGDHGRPEVLAPAGWQLSMAHSADRCVVAVARDRLGVDVEHVPGVASWARGERLLTVARRVLGSTAADRFWRLTTDDGDRVAAVTDAWVRLEAVAKWDGRGLDLLGTGHQAGVDIEIPLVTVDLGTDYRCAVAISPRAGSDPVVRLCGPE